MKVSAWVVAAALVVATGQASAQYGRVGMEQAADIAKREVGGGRVTEITWESKDGRPVWEVDLAVDGREHEILVDANSGAVLEIERKGRISRSKQRRLDEATLPFEAAMSEARAQTGGGFVKKVDLDQERGRAVWEFDVETPDGHRVEVDIDAASGRVASVPPADDWRYDRGMRSDRSLRDDWGRSYSYRDQDSYDEYRGSPPYPVYRDDLYYYGYGEVPRYRERYRYEPRSRFYYYERDWSGWDDDDLYWDWDWDD